MPAPAIIDRVRKLLKLAQSPNAHEAASALSRAEALMKKHGLTDRDVEDVEVEPAHTQREPLKDELANILANAHDCAVVTNKRGVLGFKGLASDATAVRDIYDRLCREAEWASALPGREPRGATELWRICWWLGCLSAVASRARFGVSYRRANVPRAAAESVPIVAQARDAQEALRNEIDWSGGDGADEVIQRIRARAHEQGQFFGSSADLGRQDLVRLKA